VRSDLLAYLPCILMVVTVLLWIAARASEVRRCLMTGTTLACGDHIPAGVEWCCIEWGVDRMSMSRPLVRMRMAPQVAASRKRAHTCPRPPARIL
jgi:hypothetical protein